MKQLFYLAVAGLLLASCSMNHQYSPAYSSGSSSSKEKRENQKIIYNAYLTLVSDEPDSLENNLRTIAANGDGYVQQLGTDKSVIRVKRENLDQTLVAISKLGKVADKRVSGKDVTEQYHDYEIRLSNALKARDRYLQLLEKAANVEEALKVEKELERLNGTIDLLKGKINRLDHLTAFSTITIKHLDKIKPGLFGYIGLGLYRSVRWLFVRG